MEISNFVRCGDPIILNVTSSKAGMQNVRMPRVVVEVTCGDQMEPLSRPVENVINAQATFNLSDTLSGAVLASETYAIGADGIPTKSSDYAISWSCDFYDVYVFDGEEKKDKINVSSPYGGMVTAGKSSDYRFLKKSGALSFLSLKQNTFGEEHILKDFPYLISVDNGNGTVASYTSPDQATGRDFCEIDYNPMMHHPIIFRNSFGELESCLAWCRQKIDVKVQQDIYITSRAVYDGQRTQIVDAYGDEMQIALTSGAVTPMWAQWWAYEPLRSRRAWIWMPTDLTTAAGVWVPCALKADNNTILDRSKGASAVNFTAVLDWQGGLL